MTAPLLLLLATLLPLGSFVILIFLGRRLGAFSAYVSTGAILGSFILSVWALVPWFSKMDIHDTHAVQALVYPWITLWGTPTTDAGGTFWAGLMVDSLTLVLFVVTTMIATLVHVFSIAYLGGSGGGERFNRYFAYFGLLCFSMLALVLSDSLLQIFIFWQLLGVSAYLLIGFWLDKRAAVRASTKAFILNQIGDAGFLVGLAILVWQLGPGGVTLYDASGSSVMTRQVAQRAQVVLPSFGPERGTVMGQFAQEAARDELAYLKRDLAGPHFWGMGWLTWAGICLFLGAMAKSAQFPLHVWLPDSVEGPTPVSALIHSVTIVAAAVYLVARVYPILTLDVRLLIAIIGCVTLAMGALIAVVMTDLRKVLAFSTISQLGFVMLFLGSGAYVAGLFHLVTHAFFKSCLFLGAGAVLAGCARQHDLKKLGGLWRKMPITALTFGLAVLAIAATPTFSGTYSMNLGMAGVYDYAQALPYSDLTVLGFPMRWAPKLLFWVPVITLYLTAIAMWRLWWLIFGGRPRDKEIYAQARENPFMTLPLIILGALAWVGGFDLFYMKDLIRMSETASALGHHPIETLANGTLGPGYAAVHTSLFWACMAGPVLAVAIYYKGFATAGRIRRWPVMNVIYPWLKNRMFFDAVYEAILMNLYKFSALICGAVDRYLIDGIANLLVRLTRGAWGIAKLSARAMATAVAAKRQVTPTQDEES